MNHVNLAQAEINHQDEIESNERLALVENQNPNIREVLEDNYLMEEVLTEGVMTYIFPARVEALDEPFINNSSDLDLNAKDALNGARKAEMAKQNRQALLALADDDLLEFANIIAPRVKEYLARI